MAYTFFVRTGPPPTPAVDDRRRPDRRRGWRGGRRDTDWTRRPITVRRTRRLQQWLVGFRGRAARWLLDQAAGLRARFQEGLASFRRRRRLGDKVNTVDSVDSVDTVDRGT